MKRNRKKIVVDYDDLMGKTVKRNFDGAKFKCVTIQYSKKAKVLYVSILRCYDFEHIDNADEYACASANKQIFIDWDNFFLNYKFTEKDCETISGSNFSNNFIKANWNKIKKVFLKDFQDDPQK
tara:strand:- start:254 stop:625 length:372 start_codon:yes stop_codon:yes gene_type:complete